MTEANLNELFPGWTPVKIEDDTGLDFNKPIKGKYVARIDGLSRYSGMQKDGETPYDFVSLKMQICEDVEGDRSANRYVNKSYSCIDGKYSTADEDLKRLLNDLFTADIINDLGFTRGGYEGILEVAENLKDKIVKISCWGTKSGKQSVKIVADHKLSGAAKKESTDDIKWDE